MAYALMAMSDGQVKILVGNRLVDLPPEALSVVEEGGRVIGLRKNGEILLIPAQVRRQVEVAVDGAVRAFSEMQGLDSRNIDRFFELFADLIDDENAFGPVIEANVKDVEMAKSKGRATGRLLVTSKMRTDMVAGLRMWAGLDLRRLEMTSSLRHEGWTVESWRSPLGVVAFVFEGRPNVFADATGVLKSGNTVVFRIGSDALGTARAIRDHILEPALRAAGLPLSAVSLIDSPEHSAGWALFDDPRVGLAVARGSGPAVNQLGEIAQQAGTPVSLHGTGGAWLVVGSSFDHDRLAASIKHSLDRKVCNTLNTLVLPEGALDTSLKGTIAALRAVAESHGGLVRVHCDNADIRQVLKDIPSIDVVAGQVDPGTEWEWDQVPELTIIACPSIDEAIDCFNRSSPRFVLSVVTNSRTEAESAWARSEAPFFGDGFTRWVDGQYALSRPELGLANWQGGRLLGRGGILSGDSVHTIRLRVRQDDIGLHR